MIQEKLKDKDKDLKGIKKALGEMLDRSWEKGYVAGFDDGYATRREADIDNITDLLETEWGYEGIREDVSRILRGGRQ